MKPPPTPPCPHPSKKRVTPTRSDMPGPLAAAAEARGSAYSRALALFFPLRFFNVVLLPEVEETKVQRKGRQLGSSSKIDSVVDAPAK